MHLYPQDSPVKPFNRQVLRRTQSGLSLIELMIAMLIGSFLILGITEIFINNQKSYLFQQSQVSNQENGRFALTILEQELSKAGYRSYPSQTLAASSGAVANCIFPDNVSTVALSATRLCIRYQASNRADVSCQGTGLAGADQNSITRPYNKQNKEIVERIEFDSATQSITCTTDVTRQLVTGVADVRFDYGSGDQKSVTSFSTTPGQTIGAVRYAALMQSGAPTIRDTTDKQPQALSDWNSRFGATIADPTNTQIYQIVQGTIMLRNQMP